VTSTQFAVLASSLLALASASAADRPVAVVVTNAAVTPVPVVVTNPQGGVAPVPRTLLTDVSGSSTATVMPAPGAGKRFVVRYLAMFMVSNNSGVPLTDANCMLSLHQGSTSFTVATYTLQRADVLGAMGLSQGDYLVLGPTDSLDMLCMTNPANSGGRVTVGGDLLSGQ
jgi:hypothetical protein